MSIDLFKECFKNISIKELIQEISFYKKISYSKVIEEEKLRDQLRKNFKTNIQGKDSTFFLRNDTLTKEHQSYHFYRIRKFDIGDYKALNSKLFPSMIKEQDAWNKPESLSLEYGRLNRPNHSVLYASSRPSDAIHETGCRAGECFFLIVYKSKKRMRVSQVHKVDYMDEYTEIENAKRLLMHNFLLSEFTRLVPKGCEHLYKSSLLIYEEYFKDERNDGFTYPTVASNANLGFNICFEKNKMKENLELLGVIVCKLSPSNNSSEFTLEQYYDGFLNDNNSFDFHSSTSDIAKCKFGDFSYIRNLGF